MPAKKANFLGVREVEGSSEGQVPLVPPADSVVAILCSDLHLSHKPPLARSAEPDWYATQKRTTYQLVELQRKYLCPVVLGGDLGDKWNWPPELITFALDNLPDRMIVIPGQHDLPLHSYKDLKKSAFWVLVKAGKVTLLEPNKPIALPGLVLHGFPWGFPVKKWQGGSVAPFGLRVAVVHSYIWTNDTGYVGAPKEKRLGNYLKDLHEYDVAVFGDNHKGFLKDMHMRHSLKRRMTIFNCGTLMRRKADERDYKPCVGLLYGNGTVKRHYLDCSEDKFLEEGELAEVMKGIGFETLVEQLSELGSCAMDFADAVKRLLERDKVPDKVKTLILKLLENANG